MKNKTAKQKKKQLQCENGVATVLLRDRKLYLGKLEQSRIGLATANGFPQNGKPESDFLRFRVFGHTSLCSLLQRK